MSAQPAESPVYLLDQYAALSSAASGASAQLRLVWDSGPVGGNPDAMKAYLSDVLPDLADVHREATATLAADWYDDLRDVVSPPTTFAAEPVVEVPSARVRATIRWGIDPLYHPESHEVSALDNLAGAWERLVVDAHRDTIAEASVADPAAKGWARYGRGGCDFCRMLIARGAVYSERTAKFASHNHCRCMAGPSFADAAAVSAYVPSERRITDEARAERNRAARDWIAANQ